MGDHRDDSAVSPVIGTLLILATFTIVATTVIFVGRPQIVDYQERGEFQSVVNQMGKVTNDVKQLSISGNANEVRQPTLQLPRGDFKVGRGHFAAVSVGYIDPDYANVRGEAADPWEHPSFYVEAADTTPFGGPDFGPDWDATDGAVQVVYQDKRYPGALGAPDLYLELHRWVEDEWVLVGTGATAAMWDGKAFAPPVPFDDGAGNPLTLADGPWMFRAYQDLSLSADILVGEVYLYDQTQLQYHYNGELGPRHAFAENGALFVNEHNQYRLLQPGLVAAPDPAKSGSLLTLRAATVTTSEGSASGRVDLGFLMRVVDSSHWVDQGGAAAVRIQMSGPFADLWHKHMEQRGFTADPDPALGVYHVDDVTNAGEHTVFPANLIWSQVDLKVRET